MLTLTACNINACYCYDQHCDLNCLFINFITLHLVCSRRTWRILIQIFQCRGEGPPRNVLGFCLKMRAKAIFCGMYNGYIFLIADDFMCFSLKFLNLDIGFVCALHKASEWCFSLSYCLIFALTISSPRDFQHMNRCECLYDVACQISYECLYDAV